MQRHPEIPKTASASRHERYWLLLFVALAAALRLTQLGERPFHHDESIHAWFAYQIFQGQAYRFDPVFHGPWLYWSNALVYVLLGASDFTARLLPALASTAMLLPLWMLRRELGVIGWKVTAAFVILSPTLVYYGRFLGHDSYCALFTLLWVALAFAWHRWPLPRHALALGVVTGLFFATKAVAFIHIGLFAIFVGLVLALDTFAPRWPRAKLVDLAWRWLLQRRAQLGLALLSAGAVYMALYSSFFTHWPGIIDGVVGTLDYWSGQHVQPRIPGPIYYYLPRLTLHEPVFWASLPALWWAARYRQKPFDMFLAYWMVAGLAIYGYAQEKVPWLLTYMLLPMLLLAGRWAESVWQQRRWRAPLAAVLCLLLTWSVRDMLWLSFRMPPAAPHLLTYMASTTDLKEAGDRLQVLPPGTVFLTGRGTWPLAWYLRDAQPRFELGELWRFKALAIVANGEDSEQIRAAKFSGRDYPLMTWWYPGTDWWRSGVPAYLWQHKVAQGGSHYEFTVFLRDDTAVFRANRHD